MVNLERYDSSGAAITPELYKEDIAHLNDQYLWMYTRGVELHINDRESIVADHKKPRPSGRGADTCKIIIGGYDQPGLLYHVSFGVAGESERQYSVRSDGWSWGEHGKTPIGQDDIQQNLLNDFEAFFGTLDARTILQNRFTTDEYRSQQFFQKVGSITSFGGGGMHSNSGQPKYYKGYKAKEFVNVASPRRGSGQREEAVEAEIDTAMEALRLRAQEFLAKNGLARSLMDAVVDASAMKQAGLSDQSIYRLLAKKFHPDHAGGDKEANADVFKNLHTLFTAADGERRLIIP